MNKYLVAGFLVLLIAVSYLFGKVQTLSSTKILPQTIQVPTVLPSTPLPTQKVQVIYKTPVSAPTQQSKVQVAISEVGVAGTYYCYADKANTLIQKQVDINNLHKIFSICADQLRIKINSCTYNDPNSTCPSGTECNSKSDDILKAQTELSQMIRSYCP